ncbi:hypothetical protein CL618_03430 [archaeon]|nr:hypothetical protein [archaeon]|tara:strand:+ start:2319 stop:2717 length:399 start_codon:yes stop_codon:yes gene_type:complete
MKTNGVSYLTERVDEEHLPVIRQAIEDLPEGCLTLAFPTLDQLVVVNYNSPNDIIRIAVGSTEIDNPEDHVSEIRLDLDNPANVVYAVITSNQPGNPFVGTIFRVEFNGHSYSFDQAYYHLEEHKTKPLGEK